MINGHFCQILVLKVPNLTYFPRNKFQTCKIIEEKKLGLGLLVLEFDKFNRRRWMFECKLDPHLFRVLVTKLVNKRARLAMKANSKI